MAVLIEKFRQKLRQYRPYLIIAVLVLLLLFVYLWDRIVFRVMPGEAGVLYRLFHGGTVIEKVYPEGIHLILPWNRFYTYNVRVQANDHSFTVLSKNGLDVKLFISIRYHPEYDLVAVLHKRVGPDYLNTIIIPKIESVLRVQIGLLEAEEVYTTKRAIIEKTLNSAVEQIAQRYIRVDDVMIKRIELPDSVAKQIQEKIRQKHMADAYRFRLDRETQEARRKAIEAGGLKNYNEIVGASLTPDILHWLGIRATLQLAESDNAKVVVVGSGKSGLPIIGNIPLDIPDDRGLSKVLNHLGTSGSQESEAGGRTMENASQEESAAQDQNAAQEDNAAQKENASGDDNAAQGENAGQGDNAAQGRNRIRQENGSQGQNAAEKENASQDEDRSAANTGSAPGTRTDDQAGNNAPTSGLAAPAETADGRR